MNSTELKGYIGEWIACIVLIFKGFSIVARRYKTKYGEIDIVAKRKKMLTFVEVKNRKNEEKCFIAITPKQMKRVQNASYMFISRNPKYLNFTTRYDVILVPNWRLPLHIENITM